MLKNIKSEFFIKIIFMHLNNYRLLKTIKYDKFLQNKLNIGLYNYKLFKGRFIEYDSKGRGKDYFYLGAVKYEGEYLNGERNGKGKEYSGGNIIFEGEYLNGKRWNGKGEEYYSGKFSFNGEYLNGKRWNGQLTYKFNLYKLTLIF